MEDIILSLKITFFVENWLSAGPVREDGPSVQAGLPQKQQKVGGTVV